MQTLKALKVLFDVGDIVAYGHKVYDTERLYPAFRPPTPLPQFYSLNPLKPGTSKIDVNVAKFSNFLIEIDSMPLELQREYIEDKVPVSIITSSGGKSKHFVICLDAPIDKDEWHLINAWIHKALPVIDHVPTSEVNWTRFPNGRRENGIVQTLEAVNGRIPLATLKNALSKICEAPEPFKRSVLVTNGSKVKFPLSINVCAILDGHYGKGIRNKSVFKAACQMAERGWTFDETVELILRKYPFEDDSVMKEQQSVIRTIQSAFNTVKGATNEKNQAKC